MPMMPDNDEIFEPDRLNAVPDEGRGEGRARLRPPVGIPMRRAPRWPAPLAMLLHGLIVLAIATPALLAPKLFPDLVRGGGGPGQAGGGGGGRAGTGGVRMVERLSYIHTVPVPQQPVPPAPAPEPVVIPPDVPPPVVPAPELKPEPVAPEPVVEQAPSPMPATPDAALPVGVGGGTGTDGSNGWGPGSGGGVGSGIGTGRGSGTGPGSGGGDGTIYPPTPEFTLIPPMPIPNRAKGRSVTVLFMVNEKGDVTDVELDPGTGDSGFNRRLVQACMEYRFRPATRMDGTPVASVFPITFTL